MGIYDDHQFARASIEFGRAVKLQAEAKLTTAGILAVTALVSGILLSTARLVAVSVREGRRAKHQQAIDRKSAGASSP